jgi:hypothetical protein
MPLLIKTGTKKVGNLVLIKKIGDLRNRAYNGGNFGQLIF